MSRSTAAGSRRRRRYAAGARSTAAASAAPAVRSRSDARASRRVSRPTTAGGRRSQRVRPGRLVDRDDVRAVRQLPARGGHVPGQQRLLAEEEEQVAEPAGVEEALPAHHRRAGEEAEDRRAGRAGPDAERAGGERGVDRVRPVARLDHRPRHDDAEPGVRTEMPGGPVQRAGAPPRVVVREGHVRGRGVPHAHVARAGADVAGQRDDVDGGESRPDRRRRAVLGAVVDHDHRGPLGQFGQPAQRPEQAAAAVAGHDHDRDFGSGTGHGCPLGRVGGNRRLPADPAHHVCAGDPGARDRLRAGRLLGDRGAGVRRGRRPGWRRRR
jgi:hypothetical protein